MTAPNMIVLTREQLDQLLAKAAEDGARQALHAVGLHDERAGADIRDLRALLSDWRLVRQTVMTTVARIVTAAILGAIAGATAMGIWDRSR